MKKYLILTSFLCVLTFAVSNIYAHESNCCDPCTSSICKVLSDEFIAEKSKEELLKIKESIEQHLTKENIVKLDDNTINILQDTINNINNKLEKLKD